MQIDDIKKLSKPDLQRLVLDLTSTFEEYYERSNTPTGSAQTSFWMLTGAYTSIYERNNLPTDKIQKP
jgi:hypothetical protein